MLRVELPAWLRDSAGEWPVAVRIALDGWVITDCSGSAGVEGPAFPSWSHFCGRCDPLVDPASLFEEVKDQIDPDFLAAAERGRHNVDAVVRACGDLTSAVVPRLRKAAHAR